MVLLHRKLNISRVRGPTFSRVGGPNAHFNRNPYNVNVIFQGGGSGHPIPTQDQHMIPLNKNSQYIFLLILACYLAIGLILSTGYVAHLHSDEGCDHDLARIREC